MGQMRQIKEIIYSGYQRAGIFYFSRPKKRRIFYLLSAILVVICLLWGVLYFSIAHRPVSPSISTASVSTTSTPVLSEQQIQLQSMQQQLKQIQNSLADASPSRQTVDSLSSQLGTLNTEVQQLQDSTQAAKEASIKSVAQGREQEVLARQRAGQLQLQMDKLSKAILPQKYLPVSVLPFQVVGLDFWNGKPMVSLEETDVQGVKHYRLMGQGMRYSCGTSHQKVCANWTLQSVQSATDETKEAIFVNDHNQHVKVEF